MSAGKLELMNEHVRAIHRAITGSDPPEAAPPENAAPTHAGDVIRHFAELEVLARSLPSIAERVPPFSFAPPFDLSGTERELIVEVGVPGVERNDVDVALDGDVLVVSGARTLEATSGGRIYFHAEMARGPFRREVRLPAPPTGRPRVEVENGIVRVRVAKPSKSSLPQA